MTILDTSVAVERAKSRRPINEDITAVTLVEFPRIVYYKLFSGRVIFPIRHDFVLAHRLQLGLLELGKPQALSDLLVASIAINREEELITRDQDLEVISNVAKRLGYEVKLTVI
ncbi:MAG: type II toxin-antitoxin system VapC family toxin [Candidatus Bathyarchaeia archaeon]